MKGFILGFGSAFGGLVWMVKHPEQTDALLEKLDVLVDKFPVEGE